VTKGSRQVMAELSRFIIQMCFAEVICEASNFFNFTCIGLGTFSDLVGFGMVSARVALSSNNKWFDEVEVALPPSLFRPKFDGRLNSFETVNNDVNRLWRRRFSEFTLFIL
jgi:hypothetical protein